MSMEAVWAYRERVNSDAALASEVKTICERGGDLVALARRHGFEFTEDELRQAWAAALDGELSPFELELVSGGAPQPPVGATSQQQAQNPDPGK
jgi:predicted ribosomally synthesized peptide with nif11-like leader